MRTLTTLLLVSFGALSSCKDSSSSSTSVAHGPPSVVVVGTIAGQDAQEWTGYSMGRAGDVNGDGKPDFLVVGLDAANGGRVGLFYGPFADSVKVTQADVIVTGERGFENLGESALEAGGCDLDGDGFADLILSSPFGDRTNIGTVSTSGDNAGRVYVFYGGPSLPRTLSAATADETFVGEKPYDVAGKAVACLGDLDGDKHDDFAVGAPRAGDLHGGRVYVIHGRARHAYGTAPVGLETADAILEGPKPHELTGATISAAGDLNGDGHRDFVVGAPNASATDGGKYGGAAYVVLGTGARLPKLTTLGGIAVHGSTGHRLGTSVAAAGDFDGDKLDDLLLGGSSIQGAAKAPGEAYLVRGRRSLEGSLEASAEITLRGERAGDTAGVSVAGLGDLDGDGRADIAIGAVRGDGDVPGAGRVYFVPGRPVTAGAVITLGQETIVLKGKKQKDYLGELIRGGGDVDGDGFVDLLVSARGETSGTTAAAGQVYIVSGKGLGGR